MTRLCRLRPGGTTQRGRTAWRSRSATSTGDPLTAMARTETMMAKNFPENIVVLESVKNRECERGEEKRRAGCSGLRVSPPFHFILLQSAVGTSHCTRTSIRECQRKSTNIGAETDSGKLPSQRSYRPDEVNIEVTLTLPSKRLRSVQTRGSERFPVQRLGTHEAVNALNREISSQMLSAWLASSPQVSQIRTRKMCI